MSILLSSTLALVLAVTPVTAGFAAAPGGSLMQQAASQAQIEPVDINTATAEDLQKVPGIGEALARRIIEFRQEHGRFEKVDDLLNVRGIGVTSLDKLRPYLVVKKTG